MFDKDTPEDKRARALIENERKAALFDHAIAEARKIPEQLNKMATLEASVDELKRSVERPVRVEATLKEPAKPKGTVKRPDIGTCRTVAVMAEFLRRVSQTDPAKTINEELSGDANRLNRKLAHAMLKSASEPATTTGAGIGAELVGNEVLSYWSRPEIPSLVAELVRRNLVTPLEFGANNTLTIPMRGYGAEGQMRASWISEAGTIPVVEDTIGSMTLSRFKLGAISVFSNELAETSKLHIRSVIENAIDEDTSVALDQKFLSDDPIEVAVSPSGILFGKTPITSAGSATSDIRALLVKMATYRARRPVLICDETTYLGLMFDSDNGQWLWREELERSQSVLGFPIIVSQNVAAGTLIAMDAASIALALAVPSIDVSSSATIVLASADGTDPSMGSGDHQINAGADSIHVSDAAGTVPPSKVISAFQTNAQALRVIHEGISWGRLHPDAVEVIEGIAW